jgi:hypothetical protein
MNVGQLKGALRKLPPDMDDMQLMVVVGKDGHKDYEMLCFMGYVPLEGHESIIFGTASAVKVMVETGEMPKPPGYDDFMDSYEG